MTSIVGALDVDVIGLDLAEGALGAVEIERALTLALASAGIDDGHVAVTLVGTERMQELNRIHRGKDEPTDVLSFPVDGDGLAAGPREIGDIVISPPHTDDLGEAVVHGALHLVGMDHEVDDGEMLALQAELMSWLRDG